MGCLVVNNAPLFLIIVIGCVNNIITYQVKYNNKFRKELELYHQVKQTVLFCLEEQLVVVVVVVLETDQYYCSVRANFLIK